MKRPSPLRRPPVLMSLLISGVGFVAFLLGILFKLLAALNDNPRLSGALLFGGIFLMAVGSLWRATQFVLPLIRRARR